MDKNSLIIEIKNDLNSIKKQVEVALAKLAVLESMIELDKKLGAPVAEPVEAPIEESRDNACIVRESEPEPIAEPIETSIAEPEPVAEPVTVSVAEPVEAPIEESRDNACIVRESEPEQEMCRDNACIVRESEPEPIAEPIETPIAEPEPVAEPVEAPVEAPIEESRDNACIVRNLMSVISLGDKFRFRHDLFSDDNDLFKETIEILNTLENFEKAVDFLDEKFGWDPENATVVYFYDIIKPKF